VPGTRVIGFETPNRFLVSLSRAGGAVPANAGAAG
jgi:hypothetical protein